MTTRLSPTKDGWIHCTWDPPTLPPIEVRADEDPVTGRIVVRSLRVLNVENGIDSGLLRSIPIGGIEAKLNGPILRQLVAGMTLAKSHPGLSWDLDAPARVPLKLKRPASGKYPDSFYAQVASAYHYLRESGGRGVAARLAEANDVPVTTVHRWVKEARARGLLTAGKKGTAG